ncbi:MAG: hypothetical protein OQK76_04135 [Gammaproteobacteria bacterium]|nr:hypothetical protein [Gammaproteobacteria bacterium]MCW8909794.1 hypothetical protein [Gammaproteobacteria bacterium]MCW9005831.1 hypothetical protein [Gammaproteobacteria bacterium]MCW9056877.1 hypothetical protein [Gammaproteobacteria bacterium]
MSKDSYTIKETCLKQTTRLISFTNTTVIPKSKDYILHTGTFCKQVLLPYTRYKLQYAKNELVKIHNSQHWYKRCSKTMFENSIGLAMAMISTKIVQHFVEVREFSNLWGFFATRPVVSEATYETLSFLMEFIVALVVFTLSDHYFTEIRHKEQQPHE